MRSPTSLALSFALSAAALTSAFAGCSGSSAAARNDTEPLCSISVPAACPTPAPVYADVEPIFEQRCVTCHNGEPNSPWALNNYNHIADWQEAVFQMVGDCEMPPADAGSQMTVEEREKILAWIQCGTRP